MAGPEFFQTIMGRKFYEADVPRIAKALERIANSFEKVNAPLEVKDLPLAEARIKQMWMILHVTAAKSGADAIQELTIEVQQLATSLGIQLKDFDADPDQIEEEEE